MSLRQRENFGDISSGRGDLHGGDDKTTMNDELWEAGRPLVAVPPVHQQQPTNVRKLNTKVYEIYRRKPSDAQSNELTRGPPELVQRFRL